MPYVLPLRLRAGPRTFYRGVRQVEPGTVVTVDARRAARRRSDVTGSLEFPTEAVAARALRPADRDGARARADDAPPSSGG